MKTRIKVLFLTANAPSSTRLRTDVDWREIDEAIQRGLDRDRFEMKTVLAVRTGDLQEALRRYQPQVVHFSGHADAQGIELEGDDGLPVQVSGEALAALFRIGPGTIRCVILSACASRPIALAFRELVDDTIAMRRVITDHSAILFGSAFYRALADGEPVPRAFAYGVSELLMKEPEEADIPELIRRPGLPDETLLRVTQLAAEPPPLPPRQVLTGPTFTNSPVGGSVVTVVGNGIHVKNG